MSKNVDLISLQTFARAMGVSRHTVMRWLADGLVPGAIKRDAPVGQGSGWWEIPMSAIAMKRPKRGRPLKPPA